MSAWSKAARIRTLYAKGYSTREIADVVGCGTSYVRTCARQRDASGLDPNLRGLGDAKAARAESTEAYYAARAIGASVAQAQSKRLTAYRNTLDRTARAARRASVASRQHAVS